MISVNTKRAHTGFVVRLAFISVCTALMAAACGTDETAPTEKAVAIDPGLEPVIAALEKHQPGLHPKREVHTPGNPLPSTYQAAIERSEKYKDFRRKMHGQQGPCIFACDGMLTPMGSALMKRLDELEAHAIDIGPYEMPGLKTMVTLWLNKTGMEAVKAPETAGPAGKVLVELLSDPNFDKIRAAEALKAAGGKPTAQDVEALAQAMTAVRASEQGKGDGVATLDIAMGQRFLQLILDFKFFKKVSSTEWTNPKRYRKFVQKNEKQILEVVGELLKEPDAYGALQSLEPNDPQYKPLMKVYADYKALADKGGCDELPKKWAFNKASKPGREVIQLQKRLKCEGYFDYEPDQIYNNSTIEAVKAYQRTHNLEETGNVDTKMIRSLNVPMSQRRDQIKINIQRIRERPTGVLGSFYALVNLPAMEIDIVMDGNVIRRHRAIIGSNKLDDDKHKHVQGHLNRTLLFTTQLYEIVVNPNWILPARVYKGELIGAMERNPNYLKDNNISVSTLGSGRKRYIQGPGPKNVLGKVKFLLTESNSIFLHDTNDPYLFRQNTRTFSHGCVRVDRAVDLARWLVERDGFDKKDIEQAFRAKVLQRGFKLKQPIPLMTIYRTVEVPESGKVVFYTDVYKYDRIILKDRMPIVERNLWGSADLRPRWVPRVDKKIVEQWRAQGKPAPRDLKPKK